MLQSYRASCHCGKVVVQADLDLSQPSFRCNCSICRRNRFWPAIARPEGFRLLSGEADLTKYVFGAMKNHHFFCKHCGVRVFGVGNNTPIGKMYGINVGCLEDVSEDDLSKIPITIAGMRRRNSGGTCEERALINHEIQTSSQVYVRIGGVLYLIMIVVGLFNEALVRGRVVVSGDMNPSQWQAVALRREAAKGLA